MVIEEIFTVINMKKGQRAKLIGLQGSSELIKRLLDMGFHLNIEIEFIGRMPFSGPRVIRWGETLLALREEEAKCLILQV